MKADTRKLPAFVGVDLPGQGYIVYRINKVQQGAPDAARQATLQQQVANVISSEELFAYVELMKKKAKAKVIKPFTAADKATL